MSVGFFCKEDEWSEDGTKRELRSASLQKGDVTLCNFGANPATDSTISEPAGDNLSVAQRRSFAEQMSGARECRMAPIAYDLGRTEQPRGRSQIAVRSNVEWAKSKRAKLRAGQSVTRCSHLELAKAYAAKGSRAHPGSDASVEGQEDTPRYTPKEIEALGKRGLAFKRRNGTYSLPIVDRRDLMNAIKAWGRAAPSEAAAVKAYIKRRAVLLKLDALLPASWLPPAPVGASA
jgi:hypothetical protein